MNFRIPLSFLVAFLQISTQYAAQPVTEFFSMCGTAAQSENQQDYKSI